MSRGSNVNSRNNLRLNRWKPGQSGNPSGRPKGHVYPSNFLAGLLALHDDGTPKYTEADLEAILKDPAAAPAMKLACRWIVTGLKSGERWVLGKDGKLKPGALDPTPLRALESLADRQEGRPTMKLEIQQKPVRTPQEIEDELAATIEAHPEAMSDPRAWPTLTKIIRDGGPLLRRLRPLWVRRVPKLLESAEAVDGESHPMATL